MERRGRRGPPSGGKKGAHWSWLARGGAVADGFVRARVVAAGGVDAAVLLRATLPDAARGEPTGAVSGVALVIAPGEARLELWDLGMKRLLAPAQKLKAKGGVEVVAWMIGPQLRVDVYDARSLALLASFAATDAHRVDGRVGLYATGARADAQRLVLLTVTPARVKGAVRDDVPVGPERYLALAGSAPDGLAPEDRAGLETMERAADGEVVVRAAVEGYERLRRLGVPFRWIGSDTPFKYIDPSYLAWHARPPEATKTGFRIDRSYKDEAMVQALLAAYHQRFPTLTRLVELGRSAGDRPLCALVISDHAELHEDEPAVLLDGSHHGNELMPVENVLDAVQVLLERYADDAGVRALVDGLEIWAVPLVNPDGNWAFWQYSSNAGRKNVRDTNQNGRFDPTDGVDLNRNYPFRWGALGETGSRSFPRHEYYRGPGPASEREVRAMMRLSDAEHFVASISYHTVSNVILVPYTTDGVANPSPNEAWGVAEAIAAALPLQPTGKRMGVAKKIYPVDGVDQDHFRATQGTLALLVEGPYHNPLAPKTRQRALETTRGTWRGLLERVLGGPGLVGHVSDESGAPLEAEVVVRELHPQNGERWLTRCRDGRFDRVVPAAGRYTLDVRAPGFEPASVAVTVGDGGPTRADVRLKKAGDAAPLCGDPALLSVDAWCACQAHACIEPGPARWCRIGGACVRAGDTAAGGEVCRPDAP
ncbi:MAG: M14 family zinc carboxypeptidase [Myxococcota bacterium]